MDLTRPVTMRDGAVLRTVDDARRYMLAMAPREVARQQWMILARQLAEPVAPDAAEQITGQLERASGLPV